jgi:hypothetical protein
MVAEGKILIKNGLHACEYGVIIESHNGINKVLTLEGDTHYYDNEGKEVFIRSEAQQ